MVVKSAWVHNAQNSKEPKYVTYHTYLASRRRLVGQAKYSVFVLKILPFPDYVT